MKKNVSFFDYWNLSIFHSYVAQQHPLQTGKVAKMNLSFLAFFFFFLRLLQDSQSEPLPNTSGYTCPANQTTYPCQAYAFYRASSPDFLDLASIGDLFSVSRLVISKPSNISSPATPLVSDQPLLIPLECSCNTINSTYSISFANITYTINAGDTYYVVSTTKFKNLTTYQSVEVVNPDLIPTLLPIGSNVNFPIFCRCPNSTQLSGKVKYLISYVLQPSDTLASVASLLNSTVEDIVSVNGNSSQATETIFVPVSQLPHLDQPSSTPSSAPSSAPAADDDDDKGVVIGLAVGLTVCAVLLILLLVGFCAYRGALLRKMKSKEEDREKQEKWLLGKGGKGLNEMEVNLMADVSECLDKYRVFSIGELDKATNGFDQSCLIQGSVYKGVFDGKVYAIKKMKWNACDELKILQKVNHGNLVKLEGFCIDPEDASCYLIYEYVENGSLFWWLHGNVSDRLSWKRRLRIAIDVANGLQYIHEHTIPRVVHKDIKSSNILLDSTMRAKVANFGLARSGCNAITMHIVGTQGYVAPEYLVDGIVTTKMDVFSFGVVLLELISGKEAMDKSGKALWLNARTILDSRDENKEKRLTEFMDNVLLEESCSQESVMNVMNVAIACLNNDPAKRPSMVDIVYTLCKSDDLFFDISEDGLSTGPVLAR